MLAGDVFLPLSSYVLTFSPFLCVIAAVSSTVPLSGAQVTAETSGALGVVMGTPAWN